YVGILPLILFLLFFISREVKLSLRIGYLLLVAFFIASFYLQPLDLFWQGMHAPNMFLHRYSWLLSLLIVLLAGETLNRIKNFSFKRLLLSFLGLSTAYLLTWIFQSHYSFIESVSWLLSLAFLLAYAILFTSYFRQQIPGSVFRCFTFLFCIFELALSTYYVVGALGNEWVFPTREGYLRNMSAITKLVSDTKQANKTFYRTERLEAQTGNDSMKFNYNGISQFSSIRNTASSSTLDRLGFKSEGTNLNLRYQNNTIIADSLFGIKYNLSNFDLNKYGFNHVTSEKTMGLYQNNNASQLAILTDGIYKNIDFTVNTLDNQTSLLNALSGLNLTYFKR
ncbi:MAG: YfhO family protein, partial [Streptococcus salivarius]|nr:YfhO family protein [Streptococcus salivarius]